MSLKSFLLACLHFGLAASIQARAAFGAVAGSGSAIGPGTPAENGPVPGQFPDVSLIILAVLAGALLLGVAFLFLRGQSDNPDRPFKWHAPPPEGVARGKAITPPTQQPEAKKIPSASSPEERTQEVAQEKEENTGDVAAVGMDALLRQITTRTNPGILVLFAREEEKRLYFRNGRIIRAVSTRRAGGNETGSFVNKVAHLLIRKGKITKTELEQALDYRTRNPGAGIGESLIALGSPNEEELREALTRQAESMIFSLFIFPEGRFEFIGKEVPAPPEGDLELGVLDLLEQADCHEALWKKIRAEIPSLDTVLDFGEGGREKLKGARMTPQQKRVVFLVDGRRPIRDICRAATMLDLEVYRFLYLMIHSGVLIQAAPKAS